jgi:hypothetical protein
MGGHGRGNMSRPRLGDLEWRGFMPGSSLSQRKKLDITRTGLDVRQDEFLLNRCLVFFFSLFS